MNEPDGIRLDIPASVQYLNVLGACIAAMLEREAGVAERDMVIYQVQLAVHELCTNIIEHAYSNEPGRIVVVLRIQAEPHRFIIETCDEGQPFNPSLVPEPAPLAERGRGLYLKRRFTSEVIYYPCQGAGWRSNEYAAWQRIDAPHPQQDRNYWRLVKDL